MPRAATSWARRWRTWSGLGLDLVFPPSCSVCHAAIESGTHGLLCTECRENLLDNRPACPRCGLRLVAAMHDDCCPRCANEQQHFANVVRLGPYEGELR